MSRKALTIVILSLLVVAFLAMTALAAKSPFSATRGENVWKQRADIVKNTKWKLAGLEMPENWVRPITDNDRTDLGFDARAIVSNSPGLQVGLTTYDLQSNTRINRQVEWRGSQAVQFIWMKCLDSASATRWTSYEVWDPSTGDFVYKGTGGGIHIHGDGGRSGYVSLDVDTEGKAVIANHYSPGGIADEMATTVQYDFLPLSGNFAPYRRQMPDSLDTNSNGTMDVPYMHYGVSEEYMDNGSNRFIWPQHEYQVWDGDTITHVFSHQSFPAGVAQTEAYVHYFRRMGSDTVGYWEYPPVIVDTVPTISQCVTASRVSQKVVLTWAASPGNYPGDPESIGRYETLDPGLGHSQRINDIFYMVSNNLGASWGSKTNLTAYDSTQGGWLVEGDISTLIDSSDVLHIVYTAREAVPQEGALGTWTNFFGDRLWHWDESWDEHRVIKDATWIPDDTSCTGGAWNNVNIVRPMISYCDGKFYTTFVQFNDGPNGIQNDCADSRWNGNAGWSGTANGELYISVSDNGGRHWDVARNLTDTYTPHCFSDESDGTPVCESDHYPSMPRFGMYSSDLSGFEDAIVVDPSGGYEGNFFLDVFYVNDKFPGAVMQDAGIWTANPVKWFRVPCVEPVSNPVLVWRPYSILQPTWTKANEQIDTLFILENVGNAPLAIDTIVPLYGTGPAGWLGFDTVGPLTISHISPTVDTITAYLNYNNVIQTIPSVVEGWIEIQSNSMGGSVDSISIELIVADTVQFPDSSEIRTDCTRIRFSNTGNLGRSGTGGNGGYNLNFFNDCDTTANRAGQDNHAGVYLYEASPFLTWVESGDTTLNYGIFSANWLDSEGFRPLVRPGADSTTYSDYQYGYTGKFVSTDSTIALECEYFAPTHPDSCTFIVSKQQIYLNTEISTAAYSDVYIGEFLDWDIPSDSGSENDSDFDPAEQLFYFIGAEYEPEDTTNDNCRLSNVRYGGFAYDKGYRKPFTGVPDSFPVVKAMWSHMNADWVYPTGGFPAGLTYQKIDATYGYERWISTNPTMEDSQYQDLHQVTVFGQYDITEIDTLVFIKILMSEYDAGLAGLEATLAKARAWIAARPGLFGYPNQVIGRCCFGDEPTSPSCEDITRLECEAKPNDISWEYGVNCTNDPCPAGCECIPGDADGSATFNMLDILHLIAYLYKGGPTPTPYTICSGDADGSCSLNMLDILHLIAYLYKGGPAPVSCETWVGSCGPY
jgi:hypothetical protein